MKSLLEKIDTIDELIRQLRKIDSRMRAGQWIDAWRENNRIIGILEKEKKDILTRESGEK